MPHSVPDTILFDGVCNLCNGFVQFVIRRDPGAISASRPCKATPAGPCWLAHGLTPAAVAADPESVLLLSGGRLYSHSAAVLRIAEGLGGAWRVAALGRVLPAAWRDAAYRFVARHRYRWFGRQESCMLPTPALKARFL